MVCKVGFAEIARASSVQWSLGLIHPCQHGKGFGVAYFLLYCIATITPKYLQNNFYTTHHLHSTDKKAPLAYYLFCPPFLRTFFTFSACSLDFLRTSRLWFDPLGASLDLWSDSFIPNYSEMIQSWLTSVWQQLTNYYQIQSDRVSNGQSVSAKVCRSKSVCQGEPESASVAQSAWVSGPPGTVPGLHGPAPGTGPGHRWRSGGGAPPGHGQKGETRLVLSHEMELCGSVCCCVCSLPIEGRQPRFTCNTWINK